MIFVTGGTGFIGRHALRRLVRDGAVCRDPVRALLRREDDSFAAEFPGVETVAGDLDGLEAAALGGASTVVHLASKNVDHDGSGFTRVNVDGTRTVCRVAAAAGVRRLIYVSSVGVYGHGAHTDADESTPVAPDTPFSRSKAAAERIVLDHHHRGDFEGVILRHRFVYGDGDEAVMPRLIRAARKYPMWINGGRAKMSLVWAPDFAEVIARMAAGPAGGPAAADGKDPIFHVTDGRPITYREVISTICGAFGYRGPRFSLPFALIYGPLRLRELVLGIDPEATASSLTSIRLKLVAQHNTFNSRKLQRRLPDLSYATFAEGFERSLAYYRRFAA